MLKQQFGWNLKFNPKTSSEDADRMEKITYSTYKRTEETMQKIREKKLDEEIDSEIDVESNYKIK